MFNKKINPDTSVFHLPGLLDFLRQFLPSKRRARPLEEAPSRLASELDWQPSAFQLKSTYMFSIDAKSSFLEHYLSRHNFVPVMKASSLFSAEKYEIEDVGQNFAQVGNESFVMFSHVIPFS